MTEAAVLVFDAQNCALWINPDHSVDSTIGAAQWMQLHIRRASLEGFRNVVVGSNQRLGPPTSGLADVERAHYFTSVVILLLGELIIVIAKVVERGQSLVPTIRVEI